MKYSESLKKNWDFLKVYKNGTSKSNRYLVMYLLENKEHKNRLGISVSKKVGNSVVRHRITRIIREVYRLNEEFFKIGYDIVLIARNPIKGRSYREIEKSIFHLGRCHHILEEK